MSAYFDQFRLEEIFRKIVEQLDRIEAKLNERQRRIDPLDGDTLLDNQDMCQLLKISKRTLAGYRQKRLIPYYTLDDGKAYYKASEVKDFLKKKGKL